MCTVSRIKAVEPLLNGPGHPLTLFLHLQGHVTSLVCGRSSIEVVQAIERSVRTNNEISDVDSNIVEVIRRRRGEGDELPPLNVGDDED